MRILLDTNTVVSALFWGGFPLKIYQAGIDQRLTLITSEPLIDELDEVVHRAKFTPMLIAIGKTADEVLSEYRQSTEVIPTGTLISIEATETNLRDPDDYSVLACGISGKAAYIVSGDKDLRTLKTFRDISILSAVEFWEYFTVQ